MSNEPEFSLVTVPARIAGTALAAPPVEPPTPTVPVPVDASTPATADKSQPAPKREDADALVAAAARETKAGRTSAAEELLHRALRSDRNHAGALAALAHIYFEDAQYHQAIRFAARAVDAAPKRSAYRILLGDAHFRVLAYDAARAQYKQAATLGHPSAAKRLELVDQRIGKP